MIAVLNIRRRRILDIVPCSGSAQIGYWLFTAFYKISAGHLGYSFNRSPCSAKRKKSYLVQECKKGADI